MSYRSRVYRQRNAHTHDEKSEDAFFGKQHDTDKSKSGKPFFQTKLSVSSPDDKYEKEADSVANSVVSKPGTKPVLQQKKISSIQRLATPEDEEKMVTNEERMREDKEIQQKSMLQMQGESEKEKEKLKGLQKKDATAEEKKKLKGVQKQEEPEKEKKKKPVQTKFENSGNTTTSQLSSRIEGGSGKGSSLSPKTLNEMSSAFGVDFSGVTIHNDSEAVNMNKELNAQAFTHEKDIYFNAGKYNPETAEGKRLLAHELTHVVQQGHDSIQKKTLGSKFSHGTAPKSPFKTMSALFDGRDFHLFGDKTTLMTVPAQSGRPYSVTAKDAKDCGGSTTDSYLNNPKYVGIKDNGPIPEGTYRFKPADMTIFSAWEQVQMITGGKYTDPYGVSLHGGDWGSGRVALNPVKVLPGPKGCGDTRKRSGFYLHGGSLPGSSGCIDIGNAGVDNVVKHMTGFKGAITVKVKYAFPAPTVGAATRALGRFTYPGGEDPSIIDRIKAGLSGE